jgi:arsenite methyltransferase
MTTFHVVSIRRRSVSHNPAITNRHGTRMGTPRVIARQLSHPRGLLGRLIGWLMNRHNADMNAFAVNRLALSPADRVLEIGFGGGVTLARLIEGAAYVAGVDRSRDVVERARQRFAKAVATGRAEFRAASVEALPFEPASFGKVCTVNTVYFWKSLETGFREIRRVLSPGGRLVVGFLPKDRMERLGVPSDIFTARTSDDIVAALLRSGFRQTRVERPQPTTPWNVIVAE